MEKKMKWKQNRKRLKNTQEVKCHSAEVKVKKKTRAAGEWEERNTVYYVQVTFSFQKYDTVQLT